MAERPEQERKRIKGQISVPMMDGSDKPYVPLDAYLNLLAAYEDRSKENKGLHEQLNAASDYEALLRDERDALKAQLADRSKAFENAAADCVRLEGETERLRADLDAAIKNWILPALDRVREYADNLLARAEAEAEQHAHAEHLREAREHQEEKHGA